jgi:hypothetical protein
MMTGAGSATVQFATRRDEIGVTRVMARPGSSIGRIEAGVVRTTGASERDVAVLVARTSRTT